VQIMERTAGRAEEETGDRAAAPSGARRPLVGVIVPPAEGEVPPELPQLYGSEMDFVAWGLALGRLTTQGYDAVIDKVAVAARELAARGADAVALMGTSLSFYRGRAFNEELLRTMADATRLPVTTMSSAVVEALHAVGAGRVAVATAYTAEVNERLAVFLRDSGFEVAGIEALELVEIPDIHAVGDADLLALGRRAAARSREADALLISCGGLRTLPVELPLEQSLGIPVVSSAVAGAWAASRLVGHTGRVAGRTRLLEGAR
jgi:arylmalonate decarboxylase